MRVSHPLSTMLKLDEAMRYRVLDFCLRMESFLRGPAEMQQVIKSILEAMPHPVTERHLKQADPRSYDYDYNEDMEAEASSK